MRWSCSAWGIAVAVIPEPQPDKTGRDWRGETPRQFSCDLSARLSSGVKDSSSRGSSFLAAPARLKHDVRLLSRQYSSLLARANNWSRGSRLRKNLLATSTFPSDWHGQMVTARSNSPRTGQQHETNHRGSPTKPRWMSATRSSAGRRERPLFDRTRRVFELLQRRVADQHSRHRALHDDVAPTCALSRLRI